MRLPPTVTGDDVLVAVRRVRRLGPNAALNRLQRFEPELTGLLLDEVTLLHGRLVRLNLSSRSVRRLTRRVETIGLSLALAALTAAFRRDRQRHIRPVPPLPPT